MVRPTQPLNAVIRLIAIVGLFGMSASAPAGAEIRNDNAPAMSLCQVNDNEGALLGKVVRVHARSMRGGRIAFYSAIDAGGAPPRTGGRGR